MVRNLASKALLGLLCGGVLAGSAIAQVQVQSLDSLDLFSAGVADTGLPADLWKGASPPLVRKLIPTVGAKPLSPAGVGLARRVLATAAAAPAGEGGDAEIAAARVRALLALGALAEAKAILERTPNVDAAPAFAQVAAETALIDGDDDRACRISDALTAERGAIYWVRLRGFCQARAGDLDAAQLTFTLANQQRDAVYARLMGAVLGAGEPGVASLRSGLDYALSRKLNLPLDAAIAGASPALKARLATPAATPALGDLTQAETAALTALRQARGLAAFTAAARQSAPAIAAIAQARAPLQDPLLFARAAVAVGDLATAETLRGAVSGDANPTDLALLDALIAAAANRIDATTLDRLVERGRLDPKALAQSASLIFAALGGGMSPESRADFADFAVTRGAALPARLAALDAAAGAGLKGETALLALSLAEGAAAGPASADRARLIEALRRAGLEADARAFAVEGLLLLQIR